MTTEQIALHVDEDSELYSKSFIKSEWETLSSSSSSSSSASSSCYVKPPNSGTNIHVYIQF